MTTIDAAYQAGFKQGEREKGGAGMVPAPYKQWPMGQLDKYRAWIDGWSKGRGPVVEESK